MRWNDSFHRLSRLGVAAPIERKTSMRDLPSTRPAQLLGDIIAQGHRCPHAGAFRDFVLQRLDAALGFDTAFFWSEGADAAAVLRCERSQVLRYVAPRSSVASTDGVMQTRHVWSKSKGHALVGAIAFRRERTGVLGLERWSEGFTPEERSALSLALEAIGLAHAALPASTPTVCAEELVTFKRDLETLSARERQIAGLIGRGLRSRQIAAQLGTSVNTVRNQEAMIFAKTGVNNRLGLALKLHDIGALRAAPPA
jgi:DNA-binding CsgD family transcriptional regulator